jgi:hypothetical protein
MENYAAQTGKTINRKLDGANIKKNAALMAEQAQELLHDAKENTQRFASKTSKALKKEAAKDLREAKKFMKNHPRKTAFAAVGLGALLAYMLLPRKP